MSISMTPIYVLGDGQLGSMLQEAGTRLGLSVVPMSIDQASEIPAGAMITAEREHWSPSDFISSILSHQGWINDKTFVLIPDRRKQKALLDELGLPTSPWCITTATSELAELQEKLGGKFLLKSARDGYDGKGQWRYTGQADAKLPEWKEAAIAEQFIDFETEVSIVGARSPSGQLAFYDLTENFHDDGILQLSIKTEGGFARYQQKAEEYLSRLMESLDYVGTMAIEFFVTKEGLLVNEVAPRVHNSGHWTQAGASISQFELHLRAICDLPLPRIAQSGCSLMVNLIGAAFDPRWYAATGARIHWYGKEVRPGRKLGHLNFHHHDPKQIAQWLDTLQLDERYQSNREKVLTRLKFG
jgi:5-(carboxyamino)imidazole ribonucleotide synthase